MGKDEKRSSRSPKTKTAKTASSKASKASTTSAKAPKTSAKRVKSATAPMKAVRPSQKTQAAAPKAVVDDAVRGQMIAEAAYYLAERRHFVPGFEVEDWLAAERAIDQALAR